MYGSVPYSEADKGIDGIFYPKYDKQKAIYTDLFKELEEATAGLNESNPDEGFADADVIYDGDIAKWKKLGYSLMLRMAMRISNVDLPTANTYVRKQWQAGYSQAMTTMYGFPWQMDRTNGSIIMGFRGQCTWRWRTGNTLLYE